MIFVPLWRNKQKSSRAYLSLAKDVLKKERIVEVHTCRSLVINNHLCMSDTVLGAGHMRVSQSLASMKWSTNRCLNFKHLSPTLSIPPSAFSLPLFGCKVITGIRP